jgi:ATP-dependent Zn protease
MREFEDAKNTVTMGVERRTHVMSEDEKRLTPTAKAAAPSLALLILSES